MLVDIVNEKLDLIILTGTLRDGGAEVIATNLIAHFPSYISKEIIVRQQNISQQDNSEATSTESKYVVFRTVHNHLPKPVKNILKPFYILSDIIRYHSILRKKHPSVSLSISCADNLINVISSLFSKTKPILSCHYLPSQYNVCGGYIVNKLTYFIARISGAHIVAVSNSVAEDLYTHYHISKQHIHTIYNPIDLKTIQIKSIDNISDSRINLNVPTIITVGRLNEVKGQWHLIRVFAELQKKYESQLLICGEGPEKEYLSNLVTELNLGDKVVFLGWQENPYKYMKKAVLLAHSSLSESFGNIIVEAMACGCPSVVARCSPAIEEVMGANNSCGIITHEMSGIRHPANSPLDATEISFLESIQHVLNNVDLRTEMSMACLEQAKRFDVNIGIEQYVQLINNLTFKQNC